MKDGLCERNEGKRVSEQISNQGGWEGRGGERVKLEKLKNALDSLIKKTPKMPIRSLKHKKHRNVSFFSQYLST